MQFQIARTKQFIKQYNKLPSKIQQKTVERIEILCVDEFNLILNNHRLKGEFLGQRSVNVTGDIRIIYRKEGSTIILLLQIGSHSQLY